MQKHWFVGLFLVLCAGLTAQTAEAEQKLLRMFSGPEGGAWHLLGSAMMGILEKELGISASNYPGGAAGNCMAIHGGDADLGWSYTHTAHNAFAGRGRFGRRHTNLRHLMSLAPKVLQIAVPRNSTIRTPADLADKRIVPGRADFTGTLIAEVVLRAYGITFESVKQNGGSVSFAGYADSAARMKDGQSDCYMALTSWPQPLISELNGRLGIRLLPVDREPMKRILDMERGLIKTAVPRTAYQGMDSDVSAVGTVTCIVIHKDVPDELAYWIAKTLYAGWPELAAVNRPAVEESRPENALLGAGIPVHPGALRYYRETGYAK